MVNKEYIKAQKKIMRMFNKQSRERNLMLEKVVLTLDKRDKERMIKILGVYNSLFVGK